MTFLSADQATSCTALFLGLLLADPLHLLLTLPDSIDLILAQLLVGQLYDPLLSTLM